jgi:hypothetical protein
MSTSIKGKPSFIFTSTAFSEEAKTAKDRNIHARKKYFIIIFPFKNI